MTNHAFAPYAHMIGNKFDVSAYCQDSLVTSLDRLTSVKFAIFSLVRPALKIAARSFFIERENITFSNILLHLNADTPITAPPPEARPQQQKRSFLHRFIHFITIGIPLALLVGILAGFLHFMKTVATNVITVFTVVKRLYSMSRQDIIFYQENPHLLPPREAVIDGVINTGLHFYTRRLVERKLGLFSFLAAPLIRLLTMILTNRLIKLMDQIARARAHYQTRRINPSIGQRPNFNQRNVRDFKDD